MTNKNYAVLCSRIQGCINRVSEEVLAQKRIFTDYKEEKSLKLKTFKTLQYNITRILNKVVVIECFV